MFELTKRALFMSAILPFLGWNTNVARGQSQAAQWQMKGREARG